MVKIIFFQNRIRSIIRPIINVNKYHSIRHSLTKSSLNASFVKCYSELNPKNEVVPEKVEKSDLIETKSTKEIEPSLLINEDFIKMLDIKLNQTNYKSQAYKQDEINQIIYKLENPFHLFYLYEKYSNDLSSFNLINFIKKLAYFARNQQLIDNNGVYFIPEQIKKILTKQLIKTTPHFESFQCFTLFDKLCQLGFKLNDFSVKTAMQIMKFHVNELNLQEVIICKKILNKFKAQGSNEYLENLEKAIDLVVQIKYEDLSTVKQAVTILKIFPNSISDANFEKIINFIFERLNKDDSNEMVDIAKVLAERNFVHYKLSLKIKKHLMKCNLSDSNKLKELHDAFFKLKFYDSSLHDFYIQQQLNHVKNSDKFEHEILSGLLKSSIFFCHKCWELLEILNDEKYINNDNFPIYEFLFYSALTNYEK